MESKGIRVRLAEGFEIVAKSVSIEHPESAYELSDSGNRISGRYNQDVPIIVLELDDQELSKMVEFFGALYNSYNFVDKPKLIPAKPGIKRLIDLS